MIFSYFPGVNFRMCFMDIRNRVISSAVSFCNQSLYFCFGGEEGDIGGPSACFAVILILFGSFCRCWHFGAAFFQKPTPAAPLPGNDAAKKAQTTPTGYFPSEDKRMLVEAMWGYLPTAS